MQFQMQRLQNAEISSGALISSLSAAYHVLNFTSLALLNGLSVLQRIFSHFYFVSLPFKVKKDKKKSNTFTESFSQSEFMSVHHHILQLLLQLIADAEAVHWKRASTESLVVCEKVSALFNDTDTPQSRFAFLTLMLTVSVI